MLCWPTYLVSKPKSKPINALRLQNQILRTPITNSQLDFNLLPISDFLPLSLPFLYKMPLQLLVDLVPPCSNGFLVI